MRGLFTTVGNVFPNFSFLETASHTPAEWGGPEGLPMSFLTIRQWQPRGPEKVEILSWQLLDRNTPADWKTLSRQCYERVFGVAGMFEQDDTENWAAITKSLHGPVAQDLWLHYDLGMDLQPADSWPGAGRGYLQPSPIEVAERAFYRRWSQLLNEAI